MTTVRPTNSSKNRDIRFDILKVIGLLLIILAHTKPPQLISLLREFDVPLMVISSGTLFYYSSHNKPFSLIDYLKKRIPRLLAPVWLFLAFFFTSVSLTDLITRSRYHYSLEQVFYAFLLIDKINYIWIIRVFIMIAILAPFLLKFYIKLGSERRFLLALVACYIFNELIVRPLLNLSNSIELFNLIRGQFLYYIIPYGFLFGFGIILTKMDRKLFKLVSICFFTLSLFVIGIYYYYFGDNLVMYLYEINNDYKFPPSPQYIYYGTFISIVLYYLVSRLLSNNNWSIFIQKSWLLKLIIFISSSTLWIYLWHIFFISFWTRISYKYSIMKNFMVFFIVLTVASILATYLQKKLVSSIINNTQFGQNHSKLLTTLFLR
ncbi:MAG TPA: acyltransferase [Cyanophyceae cyanobacterium]